MKTKNIYVVCEENFWADSGTSAIASFTNKSEAKEYSEQKEDRTDLKHGSQCFVVSRSDFNKKYGSNSYSQVERLMIEADGSLTEPSGVGCGPAEFINFCKFYTLLKT
ncbi:MAG: hypothetical protein RBS07_16955 [Lentimicrobium sp.]|jgi:hypothetical protein|nr:hypothetical protein [Lentimicrobium sp.]